MHELAGGACIYKPGIWPFQFSSNIIAQFKLVEKIEPLNLNQLSISVIMDESNDKTGKSKRGTIQHTRKYGNAFLSECLIPVWVRAILVFGYAYNQCWHSSSSF